MDKYERVHKICQWARNRYMVDGRLNIWAHGFPSKYQRIVDAAIDKYLLS